MNYNEILKNPHFNNLAAIIRVPFRSERWREKYPAVLFWTLIERVSDLTPTGGPTWDTAALIGAFTDLLVAIVSADENLFYTEADITWLVETLDGEHAKTTIMLLQAWYSAPDEMLTPAEVAEATNTAESTWRNKAAAGDIPGAFKKGKQWLLPRSVLRGQGVEV